MIQVDLDLTPTYAAINLQAKELGRAQKNTVSRLKTLTFNEIKKILRATLREHSIYRRLYKSQRYASVYVYSDDVTGGNKIGWKPQPNHFLIRGIWFERLDRTTIRPVRVPIKDEVDAAARLAFEKIEAEWQDIFEREVEKVMGV